MLSLLLVCSYIMGASMALKTERTVDSLINTGNVHEFGGSIPVSRVHHTMVSTGNFLIVYGGYNTDGSLIDGIEIFDKATHQWSGVITRKECCNAEGDVIETMGRGVNTTLGPVMEVHEGYEGDIPLPRAEHSAVICGSSATAAATASGAAGRTAGGNAVGGGVGTDSTDGGGSTSGGSINTAGLVNNTGGGGSRMYMFGGVTDKYGYMNDLYFFDAEQMRWTVVDRSITTNSGSATLPPRRAGHAMAVNVSTGAITGASSGASTNEVTEFYIFGGRGADYNLAVVGFNDVWRFSTVTNGWTLLTNSDTSRINRNNPTPHGARGRNSDGGTSTGSYSSPFAPAPRQYAATTIMGSRLWVFGGVDPVSQAVYNDVWAFHIYTRVWTQHSPNSGNVNGYAPPPLYFAHLIPLLPVPDANVLQFGQFSVNLTGADTTPTPPPEAPHQQLGFIVYGGMGVGGSCGHVVNRGQGGASDKSPGSSGVPSGAESMVCAPLESTLGQVYRFTVVLEDLTDNATYTVDSQEHGMSDGSTGVEGGNMNTRDVSIFDNVGDMRLTGAGSAVFGQNLQQDRVASVSWDYVRIAADSWDSDSGTGGTNADPRTAQHDEATTPTAFAKTVRTRTGSVTTRHTTTPMSSLAGKYRKTYALERVVYDYLRGVVYELGGLQATPVISQLANQQAATLILHSISLDGGAGYLAPVSWDKHSGEWERFSVDTPTNFAWVYSRAFVSSQPQQEFAAVRFLHAFRMFQVASPQDMVLLLEDYIEGP